MSPLLHYIVIGMIGTIVTVTLKITNISSSSTLYTTRMYTVFLLIDAPGANAFLK
jgi:hypothetical protein